MGVDAVSHKNLLKEKEISRYGLWVRPTINWDLQCEWNGITRQKGLEAYETKFDDLGNSMTLRKVGIFFVACMTVPLLVSLYSFCITQGNAEAAIFLTIICYYLGYILSRIVFFTFFIDLLTMTYGEREKVDANREDLQRVELLKACRDQYSYIDVERVKKDMVAA